MNYAELIATAIARSIEAPDAMVPIFKQVVLDSAVKNGYKLEETDLLDEIPAEEAREKLRHMLKNKAQYVKMIEATLPAGSPGLVAAGRMLSQIHKAQGGAPKQPPIAAQLTIAKAGNQPLWRRLMGKKG